MKISEVKFSVIIHEWEDYSKIKQKFLELLKGLDKNKIEITENSGQGLISANIYFISVKIKNKKQIEKFFKNLLERMENIDAFLEEMNFDENYNIYVRFNKDELLESNKIVPMYGENVFHLKISIDGHKKNREVVIDFLRNFLNSLKNL